MPERMIRTREVDICTETFGDPGAIPILLVMGASCSMLHWETPFCQELAAKDRFVIRYDNRDTGRSTHFDFDEQPYGLSDLARDAIGVLDGYGLESAHVVGASMGGFIAQHLALDHRARTRTITTIMSTLDPSASAALVTGRATPADALPGPTDEALAAVGAFAELDWSDPEDIIEKRVAAFRALRGSAHPFDEEGNRRICALEVERALDMRRTLNHQRAIALSPPWKERLKSLDVPTLVIHGTEDSLLPYEHARALAKTIPSAELFPMEGVGHEVPKPEWPRILPSILNHTAERPLSPSVG